MNLSVAIITYNEERILEKTLSSISDIADEIVIVDSFSTDKTEEICKKFSKVKFLKKKFEGYGDQKNYALRQCSYEWVLFLDADEIPDAELVESIRKIFFNKNTKFSAYDIKFNNFIGRNHIRHGGWGNVKRPRLFQKNRAKYSDDKIHEILVTEGHHGTLSGHINHYTYKNMHHYLEKMNLYSDMMAEKQYQDGKRVSRCKIIFGPPFSFINTYLLKLGFLDGFPGFYVAKTMAYYSFMKYMKLYSLHRRKALGIYD